LPARRRDPRQLPGGPPLPPGDLRGVPASVPASRRVVAPAVTAENGPHDPTGRESPDPTLCPSVAS